MTAPHQCKGALHCHSTYSDGLGDIPEIMAAANQAGLDFLILTDHDTMAPYDDGHEGYHGDCLLITGTEITPKHNHYLVFGEGRLDGVEELAKLPPAGYIKAIQERGWLGFIAHPDHTGTERFGIPSYSWDDWSVSGFNGMSLWDLMTDWQDQLDAPDVTPAVYFEFAKHLKGPHPASMRRWDDQNRVGRVVGIGEVDNHKFPAKYGDVTFEVFPYDWAFRTITDHLILEEPLDKDPIIAKRQIMDAFRLGRLFIGFDYWDDPSGFDFRIEHQGKNARMGDVIATAERLLVSLPEPATVKVLLDGEVIHELVETTDLALDIDAMGTYRVEAYRNDLAWIISNPIFVRT